MKELDNDELRNLLVRGWMTHDAMWLMHCVNHCGFEVANRVNKAAVRAMAAVEIKRIQRALGIEAVESEEDFRNLLTGLQGIIVADFMDMSYEFISPGVMRVEMNKCFAHDGVKRLGALEQYECGIFERFKGWFEGLGMDYRMTPEVGRCMMLTDGGCYRQMEFTINSRQAAL